MIPFSGLSRFSGLFDGDGPSPLNRDTTVFPFVSIIILPEHPENLRRYIFTIKDISVLLRGDT